MLPEQASDQVGECRGNRAGEVEAADFGAQIGLDADDFETVGNGAFGGAYAGNGVHVILLIAKGLLSLSTGRRVGPSWIGWGDQWVCGTPSSASKVSRSASNSLPPARRGCGRRTRVSYPIRPSLSTRMRSASRIASSTSCVTSSVAGPCAWHSSPLSRCIFSRV